MSTSYLKRRLIAIGMILIAAVTAFPVFAYVSLHDVGELSFDGPTHQIVTRSLFRSDAARKNLVFVAFPPPADGENVFDLAAERAKAPVSDGTRSYEDTLHGLRIDILQYRSPTQEPFPICYPGPKTERVWTGVAGRVKLTLHRGPEPKDAAATTASTTSAGLERRKSPDPRETGWVSGRIENLEVRSGTDGPTVRIKDIEIPPTRMMAGPFGG